MGKGNAEAKFWKNFDSRLGNDTLGDVGKITREGKDEEWNWIRHNRKRGRKRG